MQPVIASFKQDGLITDGAGHTGDFKALWVSGGGDIAISRDNGVTFTVYPSVPGSGYVLNTKASIVGTLAQGTKATGIIWGNW